MTANLRVMLQRLGTEGRAPTVHVRLLACAARTKTYGLGEQAMGLRDWTTAEKWLRRTVEDCPDHSMAWDELGLALEMQGRTAEATAAYQKAADLDPDFIRPLVHLAGLALTASRNQEAFELSDRAVHLKPVNMPRAWYYHCLAGEATGRSAVAESSAQRTIEEDTQHRFPRAEFVLGAALAGRGDRTGAAMHLRRFLELAPVDPAAGRARQLLDQMKEASH